MRLRGISRRKHEVLLGCKLRKIIGRFGSHGESSKHIGSDGLYLEVLHFILCSSLGY